VVEVLAWLLVGSVYPSRAGSLAWLWGPVYLSRADLSAWEYPSAVGWVVLVYPLAVGWMVLASLWVVERLK
jgi:hypothetical protein